MPLESFAIVQSSCSDDELEIPAFGESFLKKFVDLFPAAPIFGKGPFQMRGKSGHFKGELGEGRSRNSRKHPKKDIAFEERQPRELDSDSQSGENHEVCEFEAIQLIGSCGVAMSDHSVMANKRRGNRHTPNPRGATIKFSRVAAHASNIRWARCPRKVASSIDRKLIPFGS